MTFFSRVMSEIAVSLKDISKCYKRYTRPVDRLKELLLPCKSRADEFWALQDINLEVFQGQTVGVIGRNGSGKSTLLQILAGTLTPTTGKVKVNGRVSALLELGSGFNPEFTGRQNVFFNGQVLGLSPKEVEDKYDSIVTFADIGDFIEQPVKTYSSGMYVRLAFSVAINVEPNILIVDEALAVGDAYFQQRCMTRINHLRDSGVSILFVSHDSDAVKRLCDHVVVLEKGRIANYGSALDMTNWYLKLMTVNFDLEQLKEMEKSVMLRNEHYASNNYEKKQNLENYDVDCVGELSSIKKSEEGSIQQTKLEHKHSPEKLGNHDFAFFRHGDGKARIINTTIKNSLGIEVDSVYLGEKITIEVNVEFLSNQGNYLVGVSLRDRLGTDVIAINTYQEEIDMPIVHDGDKLVYKFYFPVNIKPGYYGITSGVGYGQYEMKWFDWIDNAKVINIVDPKPERSVFGWYLPEERSVELKKIA